VIFYEPANRDRELLPFNPFKALVTPRPIGWISTVGRGGEVNLAPYSYFNAVADTPPMLAFSSNGRKHSSTFSAETDGFVWNLVTYELREEMNQTSAALPHGHSEFEHVGLEMAPSRLVPAPRVAASPCAMECRVVEQLQLHDVDGELVDQHLVIGQVIGVHLDERFIVDGRVDTAAMRPVARCGYREDYTVVSELFEMARPPQ
jgi:flavin reductase (DIM6/NTAB) family NADH-FMN oxidoreductase RutF